MITSLLFGERRFVAFPIPKKNYIDLLLSLCKSQDVEPKCCVSREERTLHLSSFFFNGYDSFLVSSMYMEICTSTW